jgi:hypothetical protein
MKNLILFLFCIPLCLSAQQGSKAMESVSNALGSGDVESLSKYLSENLEISFEDKEQSYRKTEAEVALKNFFNANKPRGFSQVHRGSSKENSDQYLIGNLTATSGTFRVYIYLKSAGNGLLIHEIRLDKQ